ncbi:hypothetical protein [Paracoccus mutanolyticus]|uniref:hypothetical protein n=1 Tax=Paracoccus mutanolyticus TaxID=1499308 RepID=UPI0016791F6F|nr:hypothetical protein [Paracoccus mutanolyticus]
MDNAGLRREPGLEPYQDIVPQPVTLPDNEFDPDFDASERQAVRNRGLVRDMRRVARQISMDQNDGLEL